MGFFEPPPPPPPPPEEHEPPVWIGPPDNVLGVPFPLSLVLARNDAVAVQVHTGMAYPSGIEFSLQLLQRERSRDHFGGGPIHAWHMSRHDRELGPNVLRFGIELADGRKATVFDPHPFGTDDVPPGPVLMQRGGGGGDRRYDMRFWLWPLPPAGPLAFVVEWPAEGIELSRHAIDTAELLEAATRAEELWPGGSPSRGGGWSQISGMSRRTSS